MSDRQAVIQAAFGDSPNADPYTWTTIHDSDDPTGYVRTWSWSRGSTSFLTNPSKGSSRFTLRNNDRAWDPQYAASSFYPDVVPDLPIYAYFVVNGNTYPVLLHYADGFPRKRLARDVAEVDLSCSDAFIGLALSSVKPEHASLTTTFAGGDNDLVFTAVNPGTSERDITVEFTSWHHGRPIMVRVEGKAIKVFYHAAGIGHIASTASDILALLLASTETLRLVTVELAPGNDGSGDVLDMAPTALSGGDAASFPEELTGARIERCLDVAGRPSALRDIDTGLSTVAAASFAENDQGRILTHILDVAGLPGEGGFYFVDGRGFDVFLDRYRLYATDDYRLPVATFVDGPNDLIGGGEFRVVAAEPNTDREHIVNEWTGTDPDGNVTMVIDPASQDRYRRHTGDVTFQTVQTSEISVRLNYLLQEFAFPKQRVERIDVMPGDNLDLWETCLGLDIGKRITFKEYPPGGGTANENDYQIVNLSAQMPLAMNAARFTFGLWPVLYDNYMVLDDPVFGLMDQNRMAP